MIYISLCPRDKDISDLSLYYIRLINLSNDMHKKHLFILGILPRISLQVGLSRTLLHLPFRSCGLISQDPHRKLLTFAFRGTCRPFARHPAKDSSPSFSSLLPLSAGMRGPSTRLPSEDLGRGELA